MRARSLLTGKTLLMTAMALIATAMVRSGVTSGTAAGETAEIRNGEQLLRAMHERYAKDWYDTVSFQQDAITHNADGTEKKEIWYEAAMLPGRLRIDIANDSAGKESEAGRDAKNTRPGNSGMPKPDDEHGMLVANNMLYLFKNGEVTTSRPFVHMLLILGFDVYRQPTKTTVAQAKKQGYDLAKMHEETWNTEPMYVVGADKGDLKTKQFWVEKKRLLFVRLIKPDDQDATEIDDERFLDYRKLPLGWIAARVEFYKDGRNEFSEIYADVQANPKLDAARFDPKNFKAAK